MLQFKTLILLLASISAISCTKKRPDIRQFKVGDCFALVSRSGLVDSKTGKYLTRPTARILDVVFRITELNDQSRLYILAYQGGPYDGLLEAKDYDFADANYQKLNCDEKYEWDEISESL